jgi:hypothetical protein
MRPGPSIDELKRTGVGARINVVRGGRVLAVDVPVTDVQEDWTASRSVPTQVTFLAPPDWVPKDALDPLNNYGQRVQLISLAETSRGTVETEIGWFQISTWEIQDDGVQVTCLDLLQVLAENDMTWPSSPPSGATLRSELQRLCTIRSDFALPVVLDVADRSIPRTFQWGTDRLENVADLCESYGLTYAVKPDGCLHAWSIPDGSSPVAHYTAKDLLIDAPRKAKERIANVYTVVGGQEDDAANRYSASVSNTASPYDPAGYGVVTQRTALDSATSQAQVLTAAQTRMRTALAATETRSLEVVMDPRLEGMDVISCITDEGEPIVGRVTAYSRSHTDPSASMRVDVEVLLW